MRPKTQRHITRCKIIYRAIHRIPSSKHPQNRAAGNQKSRKPSRNHQDKTRPERDPERDTDHGPHKPHPHDQSNPNMDHELDLTPPALGVLNPNTVSPVSADARPYDPQPQVQNPARIIPASLSCAIWSSETNPQRSRSIASRSRCHFGFSSTY
jgi:hypothetical protein